MSFEYTKKYTFMCDLDPFLKNLAMKSKYNNNVLPCNVVRRLETKVHYSDCIVSAYTELGEGCARPCWRNCWM